MQPCAPRPPQGRCAASPTQPCPWVVRDAPLRRPTGQWARMVGRRGGHSACTSINSHTGPCRIASGTHLHPPQPPPRLQTRGMQVRGCRAPGAGPLPKKNAM